MGYRGEVMSNFEQIYKAAAEKNVVSLKKLLGKSCIGEYKTGTDFSAVNVLAQENNQSAVKFLITHGASWNDGKRLRSRYQAAHL